MEFYDTIMQQTAPNLQAEYAALKLLLSTIEQKW
jgi:hypothetical protein